MAAAPPDGVGGYADTLVDGGARARAPRPDSVPRPRGAGAGAAEGRALSEGAGAGVAGVVRTACAVRGGGGRGVR